MLIIYINLFLYQISRVITINRDIDARHILPVDVAGWLFGELNAKKPKVFVLYSMDWMDVVMGMVTDWIWPFVLADTL